jgi:hypothetical protein
MDWLTWLADALGASRYAQHALCLTNDPLLMILYVAGDLTTFLAYFVIGLVLISKKRHILELSPTALAMYGAFIFLCGLSHLTETLTLFTGIYRLDVMVTAAMASVSAVTAAYTVFGVLDAGKA